MRAGAAAVILALGVISSAGAQSDKTSAHPCAAALDRARVLQQVNALRAQGAVCGSRGGLAPSAALVWNEQLQTAAENQARWLADLGALSHAGRGGETLRQRAEAIGYSYGRIAENVAHGQRSVALALAGWTASEGHCLNLYDAGLSEMALACVPGRDGRPFWALLLGRPL